MARPITVDWEPLLAAVACGASVTEAIFLDARTGALSYLGAAAELEGDLIEIAPLSPDEARALLDAFVAGVGDPPARRRLEDAVNAGPGAFGRAMEVMAGNEALAAAWRAFERAALVRHARRQLAAAGLVPANEP